MPFCFQGGNAWTNISPRLTRIATHINQVRPAGPQRFGFLENGRQRQAGSMIDLCEDLDVVAAIVFQIALLAKELIEIPQVARPALDRRACQRLNWTQIAVAVAWDNDPARVAGN